MTGKKQVRFSDDVTVKRMYIWTFASRQTRLPYWIQQASDRLRFQRRIRCIEEILNPILIKKLDKIKS